MSPPTPPAGAKDLPSVTEILAAANMRRLLEAYRSLAPLTIGGPSSTSLETPGTPLSNRPTADPRMLRKFAHYPWLMGPIFPPAISGQQALMSKTEEGRRRHASCDSLLGSRGRGPKGRLSPSAPVFSPKDKESSSLKETLLEGQSISCFNVGGEDRLCLTQLLQLVLHSLPLSRIHQACDELQIFCSTCTPTQLAALKLARVLPISAAQCGLITKSDAERLCSLLLQQQPTQRSPLSSPPPPPSSPAVSPPRGDPTQFRVQHKCFGDCIGVLHPQSYSSPGAKCIECTECQLYLSPQRFVCHSHQPPETRTCHWGFDSGNWAAYIQVCEDYEDEEREKFNEELLAIKKRFSHPKIKRKWAENEREEIKRSRHEEEATGYRGFGPHQHLQQQNQQQGVGPRFPLDMPNHQFAEHQPPPPNQVFLNPLGLPLPVPEKAAFPFIDPRPLYLQWAANGPLAGPYLQNMRGPAPNALPSPYLQSLAQFHNLKALATKTLLEQQNLAKSLLQASMHNPNINYDALLRKGKSEDSSRPSSPGPSSNSNSINNNNNNSNNNNNNNNNSSNNNNNQALALDEGPQISEFVVSVSAVLETTGVDHTAKARVMGVVSRLVDRLHRVEEEKDSANLQLKGMEERVCRLEKELEDRAITNPEDVQEQPSYESSSDLGIESGTEVDDSLSEK